MMNFRRHLTAALLAVATLPQIAAADSATLAQDAGVSALWILANFSYAGMRAQRSRSSTWRIVAFFFGFPGTLVTFVAVAEGEERAYGVDLPRLGRQA
jgi:hypothetical protein